jgi:hypothetical protein
MTQVPGSKVGKAVRKSDVEKKKVEETNLASLS